MLLKPFEYWHHRLTHRGPLRLAMTLLVRNEADIIETNVDKFDQADQLSEGQIHD